MRKRGVLAVLGVIVVLLVAAAAVAPWDYLFPPDRSIATWGVFWNWSPPRPSGEGLCTWSGPVDICAQELGITFPMTDDATRQRYYACAEPR
jgi:hypothetical protein